MYLLECTRWKGKDHLSWPVLPEMCYEFIILSCIFATQPHKPHRHVQVWQVVGKFTEELHRPDHSHIEVVTFQGSKAWSQLKLKSGPFSSHELFFFPPFLWLVKSYHQHAQSPSKFGNFLTWSRPTSGTSTQMASADWTLEPTELEQKPLQIHLENGFSTASFWSL